MQGEEGQVCPPQAYVTYQQCKFSTVQGWTDFYLRKKSETLLIQRHGALRKCIFNFTFTFYVYIIKI